MGHEEIQGGNPHCHPGDTAKPAAKDRGGLYLVYYGETFIS